MVVTQRSYHRLSRLVAVLMVGSVVAVPSAGHADGALVATLRAGESVFWEGPFVAEAGPGTREADPLVCEGAAASMYACLAPRYVATPGQLASSFSTPLACVAPECFEYVLNLVEQGARLRVALDHPDSRDNFNIKLVAPTGITPTWAGGPYSMEAVVDQPVAGRWTVQVALNDVKASGFRMRAILEDHDPSRMFIAEGSLPLSFTPDPTRTTTLLSPEGCEIEPGEPRGTLAPRVTEAACHSAQAAATSIPAEFTSAPIEQPLALGGEAKVVLHVADPTNPGAGPRCEYLRLQALLGSDLQDLWTGTLCAPAREGRHEVAFGIVPVVVPTGSRLRVMWEQYDFPTLVGGRYLFGGERYSDAGITLTTGRLERVAAPPTLLLPNLEATPPFDLVFGGCQASEIAQHRSERCLRFSTGPANTGDGPLDLRIEDVGATAGTNRQWIHRSDGSVDVRPAGAFEWHAEHAHYHHVGTGDYRLYRVTDEETGGLAPAGRGPKIGFCMGDYLIADWRSFGQDSRGSGSGTCTGVSDAPLGTKMGLTRGWGDVYTYDVEGNYVDFGANTDGRYVVRVATDASNDITELVETDNHGYAYFSVAGNDITIHERGYGMSPWDPNKVVAEDGRRGAL